MWRKPITLDIRNGLGTSASIVSRGQEQRQILWSFPARVCGSAARDVVSDIGRGRVTAVFSRSFYIANEAGRLACVGSFALGNGPLNLRCAVSSELDWPSLGLRPGTLVSRDGDALRIDGMAAVPLSEAAEWHPAPLPEDWRGATLADGLRLLAEAAALRRGAGGFSALVPALARAQLGRARDLISGDALLRLAWPGIIALRDWLAASLTGKEDPVPPEVEILLGLGPGLTPSGDDLIGGLLVALAALGRRDIAGRLAGWALPLAPARTGAISAAHLACAASGEGSEALHDLIAALVTPGAPGLNRALASLAATGHSSGWDMLAGACLACALWLRQASR